MNKCFVAMMLCVFNVLVVYHVLMCYELPPLKGLISQDFCESEQKAEPKVFKYGTSAEAKSEKREGKRTTLKKTIVEKSD